MMSVTAGLVSDINQLDSNPTNLTASGGKLFFVTQDSSQGTESLWATDGTAQGAVQLGSFGESGNNLSSNSTPFVSAGGSVYFMGKDPSGNPGLFKTDGTVAGTALVSATTYLGNALAAAGGKVFFTENGPSRLEIWASDGTANGTIESAWFDQPVASPIVVTPAVQGNLVYFTLPDCPQLFASDGTPGGTIQLAYFPQGFLGHVTGLDGKVFFVGNDRTHGDQLWASDGTPGGTTALTDFTSGVSIYLTQNVRGTIYFVTHDFSTGGSQIWTSDGTPSGTVPLAATGGSFNVAGNFTAVGNTIYFVGDGVSTTDGPVRSQLWAINGGTAAPVTPNISWVSAPMALTALNDKVLLFAADDGSGHGQELWESDGTAAGTKMVKDLNPGPAGSLSSNDTNSGNTQNAFTVVNGVAYFSADDGAHGQELWKSDGTALGTKLVSDIDPGAASSSPQSLTNVDGTLYFVANDGSGSNQLWKSDGTAGGTSVVPAQTSPSPAPPTIIGERAIFQRRVNKRGKPMGKAVLTGFALEFSGPMGSSVLNAAHYQLEEVRANAAGKSKLVHLSGVGLTVSYDTSSNTATVNVAGKHSFPKGGTLAVNTAVASAAGNSLGGSSTFAISKGGKSIGPA
jgi:ELWxxDGT repeat protein